VLVALVPTAFNHFSRVRLVFLLGSIRKQSDVVVDIKIEEGTRFPSGFVDYEIVKGIMLWNDEVFLETVG
jgi:hypothetical protein